MLSRSLIRVRMLYSSDIARRSSSDPAHTQYEFGVLNFEDLSFTPLGQNFRTLVCLIIGFM